MTKDDPETKQIRLFLNAGHPWLAMAVLVVRRLFIGGGFTGLLVAGWHLLGAFGH